MRWLGFLVFALGLFISFAVPSIHAKYANQLIGKSFLFAMNAFRKVELPVSVFQSPIKIEVELVDKYKYVPGGDESAFQIRIEQNSVKSNRIPVFFAPADWIRSNVYKSSNYKKQLAKIYFAESGTLRISGYSGSSTLIEIGQISVSFYATGFELPSWLPYLGTLMLWAGPFIWFFGQRRRNRWIARNSPVSKTKWGRGG